MGLRLPLPRPHCPELGQARGPWFCYDLGLGRVRGGLVAHCPTTPHLHLSSSHIGGALPGCWALSSTLPPRGTVVGGPVLAFGFKDGPEAPPPPPPLPRAWSGPVALCPKAQGPSQPSAETFSPLTRQPPYQALLQLVRCRLSLLSLGALGTLQERMALSPCLSPKLPPTELSTSPSFLHQAVHLQ